MEAVIWLYLRGVATTAKIKVVVLEVEARKTFFQSISSGVLMETKKDTCAFITETVISVSPEILREKI